MKIMYVYVSTSLTPFKEIETFHSDMINSKPRKH